MDLREAKRLVRRRALAARARLTGSEREAAGAVIAASVLGLPEVEAAATVLAYASFGAEVPTDALIEALLARGTRVLLPAVDGDRLRALPVRSLAEVAPGYRGIREPRLERSSRPAADPAADVVLVPGVAFDAEGRRLGYGGGFYDGFLAEARGLRVGICFEAQIVAEVPAGDRDERVDLVVTETRTLRIGR